jgi:hypothetical protein
LENVGAPDNCAGQWSLTLTLSRQRARELGDRARELGDQARGLEDFSSFTLLTGAEPRIFTDGKSETLRQSSGQALREVSGSEIRIFLPDCVCGVWCPHCSWSVSFAAGFAAFLSAVRTLSRRVSSRSILSSRERNCATVIPCFEAACSTVRPWSFCIER